MKQISKQIDQIINTVTEMGPANLLYWKIEKQNDKIVEIDPVQVAPTQWSVSNNNSVIANETICRSCTRNKKVPTTRTKGFLWEIQM